MFLGLHPRLSYCRLSARRETGRRSQTAATAGSWSYRDANPTGLRPVAYGTAVTDRRYRFARIHLVCAKDATWKSNVRVTTHLTPGRTSAWHHSPKKRVKRSQRPGTCLRPCPALPFGLRGDESRRSLDATRPSYGGLSARRETGRRSQTAATAGSIFTNPKIAAGARIVPNPQRVNWHARLKYPTPPPVGALRLETSRAPKMR